MDILTAKILVYGAVWVAVSLAYIVLVGLINKYILGAYNLKQQLVYLVLWPILYGIEIIVLLTAWRA